MHTTSGYRRQDETRLLTVRSKVHSQSRCIIMRDAGYTRADAMGVKFCCLFFARGCCPLGYVFAVAKGIS